MNLLFLTLMALFAWCARGLLAEIPTPFGDETLHYSVSWPSGLSLGEGEMSAKKVKGPDGSIERWEFELVLEAAVPGFRVVDRYRSVATPDLCSLEFEKESTHGKRKTRERTTFEPEKSIATRQTLGGGGKSEISISSCAKDALAFLYYVRSELSRGRVAPPETIFFGAPYSIRLEYGGRQTLRVQEHKIETDRLVASVKGKASDVTFEIFFALDEARRPVMIRAPLPLGMFSMQLVE